MKAKSLSIIIPVYNESKRITDSWKKIKEYFKNKSYIGELIFINDGSSDNTFNIIKNLKAPFPVKTISYKVNRGKLLPFFQT